MKKRMTMITAAAVSAALLAGCSMTGKPSPVTYYSAQPDPVLEVFGDYALMPGAYKYTAPDNCFSIQLPEGTKAYEEDLNNIVFYLPGPNGQPEGENLDQNFDKITVSRKYGEKQIYSLEALKQNLITDNSIALTDFKILTMNGMYTGYKYAYSATDNENHKTIRSVYYAADGMALITEAKIINGGNDANVKKINDAVDTFVNLL